MSSNAELKELTQKKYIHFSPPNISDEEIKGVVQCLESGWLTAGIRVREFEEDFAAFIGQKAQAIAVNSATAGLLLALEAIGVGPGDEVITTPYTFSSTAMNVVHLGATPVFVDVDPVTFNIDPAEIEAAITGKTKAIIPVHFAGLACDMEAIFDIAKRHNLRIIEDAAHALPTTWNKQLIGTLQSDATVYSFYATKTITTGEGGMIVTRDEEIAKRCRITRQNGISKDVFDRYTSERPKWHYEVVAQGYKCNMTDVGASIGIPQLRKAYDFHKRRSEIQAQYRKAFANLPLILPAEAPEGDTHSWHLFVIRLTDDAPISREAFIETMSAQYQIGCSVHFIPLNLHSFWQNKLGVDENSFPVAVDAYSRAVSLPLHTKMTDEDVERVIAAVRDILKG